MDEGAGRSIEDADAWASSKWERGGNREQEKVKDATDSESQTPC
jgi:hypothetical protein